VRFGGDWLALVMQTPADAFQRVSFFGKRT